MKTPTLDKLLSDSPFGASAFSAELRAAVAEDMRAACEQAWAAGFSLASEAAEALIDSEDLRNPYARKEST